MGKSRTKVCAQKENYIRVKTSNSKGQKSVRNRNQTLEQKYRNILGPKQPIVLLQKCLFLRNIFYKGTSQDLSESSIDDRHDTSKLICPTNRVSYQSPRVEETTCNDLIHNSRAARTKSSKKDSRKTKKCNLIDDSNDDRIESSKKAKKKITVRNNNCSLSVVPSDTKISNNLSKTLKRSNTSLRSKRSIQRSVSTLVVNKIEKGQTQENNLILMENIRMPCTQNKKRRKQKNVSACSALTNNNEDKEYSDTMLLQEKLLTSNNNFLTKHTVDSTVEHAVEHTAVEHTVEHTAVEHTVEHTAIDSYGSKKSKGEISPLHNRNAARTIVTALSSESLDTSLKTRFRTTHKKKLRNHTMEHTAANIQNDPIAKGEALLDTDIIQSSENLDTAILEEWLTTSYNNSLNEQNTEKHTVPDTKHTIITKEEPDKIDDAQCDALHHRYGNSWTKQKRLYGKDNNIDGSRKKVKLNRSTWYKIFGTVEKTNDTSEEVETTNKDVDLNNNKEVPELIPREAAKISAAAEANLTEGQDVFNRGKQNLVETFGYSTRVECDARTDAEQSQDLAIETCNPVIQDTSLISENANFNTSNLYCDDDDYISLYADSMIIEECDIGEPLHSRRLKGISLATENQYVMSDNAIDIYYKKNALEFNEAYNVYASNSKTNIPQEKEPSRTASKDDEDINSTNVVNRQMQMDQNVTQQQNWNAVFKFFRGYCYKTLMHGKCLKQNCRFEHDFQNIMTNWYNGDEKFYFTMIDELILNRCNKFLQNFFGTCITLDANVLYLIKVLKKLCDKNIVTISMAYDFLKKLISLGISLKVIVDNLAAIVDANDVEFVNSVSQIMSNFITPGQIWLTLKPLLGRVEKLTENVAEVIMAESILTTKHIQDVYENALSKLDSESLGKIKPQLLLEFNRIFMHLHDTEVEETEATNASLIGDISSPDDTYEPKIVKFPKENHTPSTLVWHDVLFHDNNNSLEQKSSAVLHPIDNVTEPYSRHGRERFWKFYLDVHSLQEGLKYGDYDHIKSILDAAQTKDATLFTGACYNILLNKVEHANHHLSRLVSLAVQTGATATFCKILIDVTICILTVLAERELWVLALELLKSIKIVIQHKSSLLNFNAAVTMLFGEIYLANRKPMKAFILLKQSNIIHTCRNMWKVSNNERDEDIRTQIVTLLLDSFCDTSPEHAFNLFEFLISDQSSNFYPIDLMSRANRLVSVLLLKNDHNSIVSVAKLIDDYSCALKPITYRALISTLVGIDSKLAKQLYHVATNLGVYSKMLIHPVMGIIVKSDWTREEMYLAVSTMMEQLAANVGHAISGITPKQVSLHLIFEATSLGTDEQRDNKLQKSITLMKTVLETEFDPPLSMIRRSKGKFHKINGTSVCNHLRSFMQSV
ncbi:uncharacterized protein LOC117222187 isoform X1 [Megalopta genalis]|uniref:uncharacterized protein LOC117222187 isoform X1 n=1 Tax=Megalopta genalis TaxID=115081 RepID=UPI003FD29157